MQDWTYNIYFGVIVMFLFFPREAQSQQVKGLVIDSETGGKLAYVHIGVKGKNIGVISNDKGEFQIDLDEIDDDELLLFSSIGYETTVIKKNNIVKVNLIVKLNATIYELDEVVITANQKESDRIKLGRYKLSKTTTGQSGIDEFGSGGEWGVLIKYTGRDYYLEDVNFHSKFNTVDSVLYRINIYNLESGLPGKSKLKKAVFVTSIKYDKWIKTNLLSNNLLITDDIIVTFELVRISYSKTSDNQLFYTHGKKYEEGTTYSRNSSFDDWSVNKKPPITMYVTGLISD